MSHNDTFDAVRESHERQDRIIAEGCKTLGRAIGGPLGFAAVSVGILCDISTHLAKKAAENRQQQS